MHSVAAFRFCGYVPIEIVEQFVNADNAAQLDIVIELACAWYVRFIQSWQAAARTRPVHVRVCKFERLEADELGETARLARFAGLDAPRDEIAAACAKIKADRSVANINVGRSGRGRSSC